MKYAILSVILLAGFVVLAFLISNNDGKVAKWDVSAFNTINNPHDKTLNKIMVDLTTYGREAVWIGVIAFLFLFGKKDGRKVAVLLIIVFLILIPLGTILKTEITRSRPIPVSSDNLLIQTDANYSFPSGHATIVSAGALVLLSRFNKGRQIIFSVILGMEALLVSYSRIYVGDHYPLDVVGGILLGTGIACAVIASSRYLGPIFSRIDSMKR
jgi:membrane-associated phospholipid phosphatase